MSSTNQMRNKILVQIDINKIPDKIRNVPKNCHVNQHASTRLDIVADKIKNIFEPNVNDVPSLNKPNLINGEIKQENVDIKTLEVEGKNDKKKSKTVCTMNVSNFNMDTLIDTGSVKICVPDLKLLIGKTKRKKKLVSKKKSELKYSAQFDKDNIKCIENKPRPMIKKCDGTRNKNERYVRFKWFVEISLSDEDDANKSELYVSTTDKTSEIGVCKQPCCLNRKNNTNTASMDESNMSKSSSLTDLPVNSLNDTSTNSVTKSVISSLDSNLVAESSSVSCTIFSPQFDYANNKKYKMLQDIVEENYKNFDKKIIHKLAKKLRKNQLLWKFNEAWYAPHAELVKRILEKVLKHVSYLESKNIVFMGCLSIIFRRCIVDFNEISETDMYNHFKVFTEVIGQCLMKINDCLWKTMFPKGWDIFWNGCLIIDGILYSQLTTMYSNVNWNEIPNVLKLCHFYSDDELYSDNLSSFNNQFNKQQADVSLIPSTSYVTSLTAIPHIVDELVLRKTPSDVLSIPSGY